MKRARSTSIGVIAILMLIGPSPSASEAPADPSAEAAHAAIAAANQSLEDGIRGGLPGAELAAAYTEDAIMLPPGSPPVAGREGIAAAFDGLAAAGIRAIGLETRELELHGDTAIEVGLIKLFGDGDALLDEASFIVVWKRRGDRWLLHRDIWSSDRPPATP